MEIKGSKVRTPKLTFLVFNAPVDKKFGRMRSKSEKCLDSKINDHTDRR